MGGKAEVHRCILQVVTHIIRPGGQSRNSPVSWNREEMPGGKINLLTGLDPVLWIHRGLEA